MIKIGDEITLEPRDSKKPEKYKCNIIKLEENKIYINYPINIETNKMIFLLEGTQLKGTFIAKNSSVYIFDCEVEDRLKLEIPLIVLSYPGVDHLIKVQRRQFVRVETEVDAAIHPYEQPFTPFVTTTEDISAGGAAFESFQPCPLEENMLIKIWLVLSLQNGETHYLKLKSKVLRIANVNETKSIISVQFTNIPQNDRQLLLRFCFDRQLAIRKKGLN